MKKLRLIIGAVLSITLLFAITAGAGTWYVVKHQLGDTLVIDYKPGPNWTVVSGPYDTKAQAAREGGVDIPQDAAQMPMDRTNPPKKAGAGKTGGNWYVAKHKGGDTVVIDYKPGPNWSVVSGPHPTKKEAAREGGIDIPVEPATQPEDRRDPPEKATAGDSTGGWYVVKSRQGETTIVNYKPGGNWTLVSGPHETKEQAAREGGVDLPVDEQLVVPRASKAPAGK
jgi:hypothetical protein